MSNRKDKGPKPGSIPEVLDRLLGERSDVSTSEVAAAAGVTRQAAHHHLRRRVEQGELEARGKARATRYRRRAVLSRRYARSRLQEHEVWQEMAHSVMLIGNAPENVRTILRYALTEILNNAIDHSQAEEISVAVFARGDLLRFEVAEEGIGLFNLVRQVLGLEDDIAALQEVSKGKVTTDPRQHTGEGIFFASKAVDYFVVESGGIRWTIDNMRNDIAIGESALPAGTRVAWELNMSSDRSLREVFDQYAGEGSFSKTKITVRLFEQGVRFVSRSEAKRLTRNLDRFEEVTVDFSGVEEIGRAFADELFRVWQSENPQVRLDPINMSPPIETIVRASRP